MGSKSSVGGQVGNALTGNMFAKGENAAKKAEKIAKEEQERLLKQAQGREKKEKETKEANDELARKKNMQDKRFRAKGRSSTIVTGTADGEADLGTLSTGKTALGV
jgi:hypothetical protein